MKIKLMLWAIGCLASYTLLAQKEAQNYAVKQIPAALLAKADAVVRHSSLVFSVDDTENATRTVHTAVTLLNNRAAGLSEVDFWYSKFERIEEIEGKLYDAQGALVYTIKKKDITDSKPYENFVSDSRIKTLNFPHHSYPYTLEYSVTEKHTGLLFFPRWFPQISPGISVEKSTFEVILPQNFPSLRYKSLNDAGEATVRTTDKGKSYSWEKTQIPAFVPESHSPATEPSFPLVITSPSVFVMEGVRGKMDSWFTLGQFFAKINEGRAEISPQKANFLKNLVIGCPTPACKVERIYRHLQETTRYYSIQLGLGGWQAIPASETENTKFGDCKGLSNYMVAMLKTVGIDGYLCYINRGDAEMEQFPDFPNPWFNHAIACVPLANDTLWLECTSQTLDCGFLDDSDDRFALFISPKGGKLVRTPAYSAKENTIQKSATIQLTAEGNAQIDGMFTYSGKKQNLLNYISEVNPDIQKKYAYEALQLNNATIEHLNFRREKGKIPKVSQEMKLHIQSFASKSGKRLFVPINVFSKFSTDITAQSEERKQPVQASPIAYSATDSVTLMVPVGFSMETKPENEFITADFGAYISTISKKSDTEWFITRTLVLNNQKHPKETYPALIAFFKAIEKADRAKLIFVATD